MFRLSLVVANVVVAASTSGFQQSQFVVGGGPGETDPHPLFIPHPIYTFVIPHTIWKRCAQSFPVSTAPGSLRTNVLCFPSPPLISAQIRLQQTNPTAACQVREPTTPHSLRKHPPRTHTHTSATAPHTRARTPFDLQYLLVEC